MRWSWLDEDEAIAPTAPPGVVVAAAVVGLGCWSGSCWNVGAELTAMVQLAHQHTRHNTRSNGFTKFKLSLVKWSNLRASLLTFNFISEKLSPTAGSASNFSLNTDERSLVTLTQRACVHCTEDLWQLKQPVQWSQGAPPDHNNARTGRCPAVAPVYSGSRIISRIH